MSGTKRSRDPGVAAVAAPGKPAPTAGRAAQVKPTPAGVAPAPADSKKARLKKPDGAIAAPAETARAAPADVFDLDRMFAEATSEKAKLAAAASKHAAKEEKKQRVAAAASAAADAAVKDLESVGRKANRIRGADSPVPLR